LLPLVKKYSRTEAQDSPILNTLQISSPGISLVIADIEDRSDRVEGIIQALESGCSGVMLPPGFDITPLARIIKKDKNLQSLVDIACEKILRFRLHEAPHQTAYRQTAAELVLDIKGMIYKIRQKAFTLVRDQGFLLPVTSDSVRNIMVVSVRDNIAEGSEHQVFGDAFRSLGLQTSVRSVSLTESEDNMHLPRIDAACDMVVIGLFLQNDSNRLRLRLRNLLSRVLSAAYVREKPVVVLSFGEPQLLPLLSGLPHVLQAYDRTTATVNCAVQALFGRQPLKGKLPAGVPDAGLPAGFGLERSADSAILLDRTGGDLLDKARNVLEQAIGQKVFPAAQMAVVRDNHLIESLAVGRFTYYRGSTPATTESIFDVSSLTKVAATALVAMKLWQEDRFDLQDPVGRYLPEFNGGARDSVTVMQLMTHASGLPRWTALWQQVPEPEDVWPYIYTLDLEYSPGDTLIYSDIGFMLVWQMLEKIGGQPLEVMAANWFYKPMGLRNTFFKPSSQLKYRIPPTERRGDMKRYNIQGEVHDANAWFLGGVTAHAGLFSTAEDLAAIACMMLNGGIYNHRRLLNTETINFWTRKRWQPDSTWRGIIWDSPRDRDSSAGEFFSPRTYGHLGFTGTSLWIDPDNRIAVVLLTNRTWPSKRRPGIHEVRREFHNRVMQALLYDDD
jgi:CubicO group peptidase (beta-lactamase class C family)